MKPQQTEEVTENIEVVTPGALLKEARVSLQLTPVDIAKRLNLKDTLIEDIENNEFDDMPSITFARGYLKGYAKLVHVSESEVIEAFEYLSTAEQQQLEMQSFSHLLQEGGHVLGDHSAYDRGGHCEGARQRRRGGEGGLCRQG